MKCKFSSALAIILACVSFAVSAAQLGQYGVVVNIPQDGDTNHFLNGAGALSTPSGSGGGSAPTNTITGNITSNVIPKGNNSTNLVDSTILNTGTNVAIAGVVSASSGVFSNGVTIGGSTVTSFPATTTTQTNFVLNTVYTNGTQTILARATVALTGATVSGTAAMDLMVDQAGGTSFSLLGRSEMTTTISLALNVTNVVNGVIIPLGTYYWTNSSSGSGNSSLIVAGTGQIVTMSSGTNGATGATGATGANGGGTNAILLATQSFRTYQGALTHAGTVTLDFDGATTVNSITITGNVTFATSNLATNRTCRLRITGTTTNAVPTFPATWSFLGGAPALITSNTVSMLSLESWGTTDASVVAAYLEAR